MSFFAPKVNPITRKQDWILRDEDHDLYQEIARSAYADMLHDTERNEKYEAGLILAINSMKSRGRPCNVLDIGTGTGILSMMAVRNGADTVTACDAFEPAAKCAEKIIEANAMKGSIRLIHKRSTDIKIPEDMPCRANILVTEVFDTELIGEGAIGTFRHALQYLLESDCIVVPSAAYMYILPVESYYLSSRNELHIQLPNKLEAIQVPKTVDRYNNDLAAPLFDLQLSEYPLSMFRKLAKPELIFTFDFCGRKELFLKEENIRETTADADGICHAFFMWWSLDMDMHGDVKLSCAPSWINSKPNHTQWRDHWMQAVFYPEISIPIKQGQKYFIRARHDEYSLAFDIKSTQEKSDSSDHTSLLHCLYTRARLAMLQDPVTIDSFYRALCPAIDNSSVVLCASESSFLPFLLARLGAKKVYVVEANHIGAKRITQSIIDYNNLSNVIEVLDSYDELPGQVCGEVTHVVGEPFFSISVLPWDDLQIWYINSSFQSAIQVIPRYAFLMALVVEFENLHKIRAPVGLCEGLDLNLYDKMIEHAREKSDEMFEPHYLWEYPSISLSKPKQVMSFNLTERVQDLTNKRMSSEGQINILHDGRCNGIVLWMEYELDEENRISHGIVEQVIVGCSPKWNMERKQAVYLPFNIETVKENSSNVNYRFVYNCETGDMDIQIDVIS